MKIQIWSYNYDPEPQGIAPLSAMLARSLETLGHDVLVVAAHPHYPEAKWGQRWKPYRERREGIAVMRLPLWIGRDTGLERVRQEMTFAVAQSAVSPLLPPTDAIISVTPCFPALVPAMVTARARRVPWLIWVQDIVTDGAQTTGLLDEDSTFLRVSKWVERVTHKGADRVVVISDAFRSSLERKGIPSTKLERIFNPSSRQVDAPNDIAALVDAPPRILAMGNIGHSQGLDKIVDAFEASAPLTDLGTRLVIAGGGVAAEDVRARITGDAVEMPGVLYGPELEPELRGAMLGLVSQRADVLEFNLPSKLMNYMAYGIPVLASVRVGSETGRIVEESGCGWATDASKPEEFAEVAARVLADSEALARAGQAGFDFAREQFHPMSVARRFEDVLQPLVSPAAARA